jgi:hypothetical protein
MSLKIAVPTLERGQACQGCVIPVVIVVEEVATKGRFPLDLMREKAIGSVQLLLDGTVKPLHLAIGLWSPYPCHAVADAPGLKGPGKAGDPSWWGTSPPGRKCPGKGHIVVGEDAPEGKPKGALGLLYRLQGSVSCSPREDAGIGHPSVALHQGELVSGLLPLEGE